MRISWGYWNDFCDRLPIGEINREIDANFGIGTLERNRVRPPAVIAGLDPANHLFVKSFLRWTRGSSPRVTHLEVRCLYQTNRKMG